MVLNRYVTTYVTKAEKSAAASTWDSINKNLTIHGQLKSFGLQSFKNRQIGAIESTHKLLQYEHCNMSIKVQWYDVRCKSDRKRRLKEKKEIDRLPDDSEELFLNNMIDTYYPCRPFFGQIDNICLYDFLKNYEYKKKQCLNTDFHKNCHEIIKTEIPMMSLSIGYIHHRGTPQLINMPKFNHCRTEYREAYFNQILLLFKPWRIEDELLGVNKCYEDAFNIWSREEEGFADHEIFISKRNRIEEAKRIANELMKVESDEENYENYENTEFNFEFNSQQFTKEIDTNDLEERIGQLNKNQREIFEKIINVIEGQEKKIVETPIISFCSGVGGTGKSFLIDCLRDFIIIKYSHKETDKKFFSSVLVAAPTGIAAFNVRGQTCHKLFKLPILNNSSVYWNLSPDERKALRSLMESVKLIIIDEISMVSNVLLTMIHDRLSSAISEKDGISPFGGKNFLVFGDLLQLKPVLADFCFEILKNKDKKKIFGSIELKHNLWDHFDYVELTENQRQKSDPHYADLLNRARIGIPTQEDINFLNSKIINPKEITSIAELIIQLEEKNAMYLCANNEIVDDINLKCIEQLNIKTFD